MRTTMERYFIGIDDTDALDSIGTGALCRELMIHLARHLDIEPRGITRHQLLVHPDIPYTSHNSSACLEVACRHNLNTLANTCRQFVDFLLHPGADPGLCLAKWDQPAEEIAAFGRRAQLEIVDRQEAYRLARASRFILEERGGSGLGVIGALSAVGLRMSGNDGRFIAHRGIREASASMTVGEIKQHTAVEIVVDDRAQSVEDAATVVTSNWLRPELSGGLIVLPVRRESDGTYLVEKRKKNQDDM